MSSFRVTTKISLLTAACALVALAGALLLLWREKINAIGDERSFRASLEQVELARTMQVDFKKQVQEWKDVLLRGRDRTDLDRYWRQFQDAEARVQADAKALAAAATVPTTREAVTAFLQAHEQLGGRYREALNRFVASGRSDFSAADETIRGMDRQPTDMIDGIVERIERAQAEQALARRAAQNRERLVTLTVIAVISIGLIGGGIWVSRRIAAPVIELTGVMSEVARRRDYSLRARLTGDDEIRHLGTVFNDMLATLERQTAALQQASRELEGQLEERKRSEARLADSLSVLNATLDSTADGLLVVDRHDRVTAVNRKFGEMWAIPAEVLAKGDDRELLGAAIMQLKNPDEFVAKVRQLYAEPDAESFDVLLFNDGRVFERYSKPQKVNGVTVGRVWSFRDVTARRRAEAELERLNKDLIKTARQAGMAEVATGVLHNVGNVLNSVNVASSTVAASLKRSKSASLTKVVALLREHEADLGEFLSRDEKGKQLLSYLTTLGQVLADEQVRILKELAELENNVEHIKDIVTRQQSFAKTSSRTEPLNAGEMMDDALKIDQGSCDRHGIEVVREFEAVPPIATDRSQVLQILVNLVRNAIQACGQVPDGPKRLTARVRANGDRTIQFIVSDSGVGIAEENLKQIFTRGFTTKKDGHGFGLHTCARMARELGGRLEVRSDGIGKGAMFTLELPLDLPRPADN